MKKVTQALNLTPDILDGATIIHIYGNELVLIENYHSILEYTNSCIKIRGRHVKLVICGENLWIDRFTQDDCKVRGCLTKIEYIPL